jgi:glycosyltransferase-like protein
MLSVGVFTYSTKPRGSVVHAMNLAEALVAAGHDATLYALSKPGARLHRTPACPVELIPAQSAPTEADVLIRQRIAEFAAGFERLDKRHDIFHAQDCLATNALLLWRSWRSSGIGPVARTVHHVERFDSSYLADCQRRSICAVDALLSVSRATQASVLEQFGRSSLLVRNGIDSLRFADRRKDVEEALRNRYGIESGDAVLLSVGGVEPRKNTLLALRAVATAYASVPSIRWIIVGDHGIWDHSSYVARFEQERAKLPAALTRRIVRAGTLPEDELTSLYALSDVLLCPSAQEGFGLCVLEAMAAGVAVVVPDRPPFTEYLDEASAALVDSDSVESVAKALVSLTSDADRRRTLVDAAQRRCNDFRWSNSAQQHLSHYRVIRSAFARAHDAGPRRSSHA